MSQENIEAWNACRERRSGSPRRTVWARAGCSPIDALIAFLTELRDGEIVRDRAFRSTAEALEAATVEE